MQNIEGRDCEWAARDREYGEDVANHNSKISAADDSSAFCEIDDPAAASLKLGGTFKLPPAAGNTMPRWRKLVFEPYAALSRLEAIDVHVLPSHENMPDTAMRDHPQIGAWRSLAGDALCGTRELIVGDEAKIEAMLALGGIAPNFASLIDIAVQALRASMATRMPMRLPPILLVGPPGVGKTFIVARMAAAFGVTLTSVPMCTTTAINALAGTDTSWKAAKMGVVARALIEGKSASPLILVDEADKAFGLRGDSDPIDALHILLEAETARSFRDEYLDIPLAVDDVIWLLTANSLEPFSASILDRCLVLTVAPPTVAQMHAVTASIYASVITEFGDWFGPNLTSPVMQRLEGAHPRQVRRLLAMACRRAASENRRHLSDADIAATLDLFRSEPALRAGFLG